MSSDQYPGYASHYRPRTRDGWRAVILFCGLFALTQPPLVFIIANRVAPRVLGMPFLYWYLFLVYLALIGVLVWTVRRKV